MTKERIPRLDGNEEIRKLLLPYCRLKYGEIWEDPVSGHKVGCLDACNERDIVTFMHNNTAVLAIQDPPYNVVVGNNNSDNLGKVSLKKYMEWTKQWIRNTVRILDDNAHFYVWLGADQNEGFQPLPDFMIMIREFKELKTRSFITMRNQRGYGTQKNWMAVRQELLYYIKGNPKFNIEAEYTDIPKILRGYYKKVNGKITENIERSKSENIRAGNVWVDIQQVFYRMEENVPGCYAQKPLKAIERIISASSKKGNLIVDFFAHAGTTLIAAEKLNRQCLTIDIDPVFVEITIRRLEHFRRTGKNGWQWRNPFPEVDMKWQMEDTRNKETIERKEPLQRTLFDNLWDVRKDKEPI
ncbi:MAG: site-specific DNA-methyltransferase, partial [Candidatus Latescibacteria bacterium]|nr:site-specific DNA-methyltransferase [Candidatus Latescibacterota bacterium]